MGSGKDMHGPDKALIAFTEIRGPSSVYIFKISSKLRVIINTAFFVVEQRT